MKTKNEVALEKFFSGYNCAQSVLYAWAPEFGLAEETALKVACGLGAGIARRGQTCGAVTGAILVLGMRHGRGEHDDRTATERTYQKIQEFMAGFEQKLGACDCRLLLQGCDLRTTEGQRFFKENDLLHKTCARCVQTAMELLQQS